MSALVNEVLVCNDNISRKITSKHVFPPLPIHIATVAWAQMQKRPQPHGIEWKTWVENFKKNNYSIHACWI